MQDVVATTTTAPTSTLPAVMSWGGRPESHNWNAKQGGGASRRPPRASAFQKSLSCAYIKPAGSKSAGSPVFAVPRPIKKKSGGLSSMMMDSPMPKSIGGMAGGMEAIDALEGVPCFMGKDNIKRITSHTVCACVVMTHLAGKDIRRQSRHTLENGKNPGLPIPIRVCRRTGQGRGECVHDDEP
jgi:hypothetical protein